MRRTMSEAWVQKRRQHDASENAPKLTEEQKLQVCQWVAEWMPVLQIQKRIQAEFGIRIAYENVRKYVFSPRWQPAVNRLRSEYVAGIMQEPIAHKRIRLQKLAQLMEQAAVDSKTSSWRKRFEVATYLEKVRLEMDERKTDVTNLYLTQINEYTDEQLLKRRDELLAKLKQWRLPNALGDRCESGAEAGSVPAEIAGDAVESSEYSAGAGPREQGAV